MFTISSRVSSSPQHLLINAKITLSRSWPCVMCSDKIDLQWTFASISLRWSSLPIERFASCTLSPNYLMIRFSLRRLPDKLGDFAPFSSSLEKTAIILSVELFLAKEYRLELFFSSRTRLRGIGSNLSPDPTDSIERYPSNGVSLVFSWSLTQFEIEI